uniref:Myb/SANT-like domain-containing protein n=1 Tax=Setaria italica TaxID=4555 RepID=K3Y1I5_SETIT
EADRAAWNSAYEKGLVEILLDYKDNPKYKDQNGWVSEGCKIITSKFNEKFPAAHFTKKQAQEKEKELKANYKALRDAKRDSGNGWNESLCMINGTKSMGDANCAKFRKKPFPLFYQLEALYEVLLKLNFTSTMQVDPPSTPAPPAVPPPAPPAVPSSAPPIERSNSEQSSSHLGANPFTSSFDGQETSSAHNERNEAQDSRQEEGESGKKPLEERKRCEEEFLVEKCVDQVDAMAELTDNEKSYALDVFESGTHRKIFITTKNPNV